VATLRFSADAERAYTDLDRPGVVRLLDAVDDALDLLEEDPGDKRCRARSFSGGLWGIPVRDGSGDWLLIWEQDAEQADMIRVRYIGRDPFS
jgi:hypothetical protein